MAQSISAVGLDVHAHQTHAAVLDRESGEITTRRLNTAPLGVIEFLRGLERPFSAVYEAGPTGFVLARQAAEQGIELRVVAPGLIPRKSGDRVKTDRRDAIRLARLLAAGELSFARVPSLAEECFRDLVRAREDVRSDLMRARHRLSKFLLRRELRFRRPGAWTQEHLEWLRSLEFDDPASTATCADYLAAVEALIQRRGALESRLAELAPESPYAETIARLRCFRGVDTLSAAGLCCEVGDFARFDHPRRLAGFLGITPSEWTSAEERRQGRITKAGSTHARRLLVEAAHHYRLRPRISAPLARRQAGQDPRVVEVAWRAQQRLRGRWAHLRERRGKPAGVVAIACARELSAYLWEAATL